jgi:hypothetical protein
VKAGGQAKADWAATMPDQAASDAVSKMAPATLHKMAEKGEERQGEKNTDQIISVIGTKPDKTPRFVKKN